MCRGSHAARPEEFGVGPQRKDLSRLETPQICSLHSEVSLGWVMEAVVAWVLKSSLSVLTTQCSGMLNSKVSGNSESTGFGYKFGTHPVLREKQSNTRNY